MTAQIVLRSPVVDRRLPLLASNNKNQPGETGGRGKKKIGEVAGGTAAECAAVCCCCPCGLMNLLVLAVYTVPAGLWRRGRRRRQRRKNEALIPRPPPISPPPTSAGKTDSAAAEELKPSDVKEAADLEKEMWDRFYSTGFWRSPSQRGT